MFCPIVEISHILHRYALKSLCSQFIDYELKYFIVIVEIHVRIVKIVCCTKD